MYEELDISVVAYELYKLDWVETHTTPALRAETVASYIADMADCIENEDDLDTFDDWLFENGYGNGNIYVCYEEFCDAEYHDKDYITKLLGNNETLVKAYYADINEDNEP